MVTLTSQKNIQEYRFLLFFHPQIEYPAIGHPQALDYPISIPLKAQRTHKGRPRKAILIYMLNTEFAIVTMHAYQAISFNLKSIRRS